MYIYPLSPHTIRSSVQFIPYNFTPFNRGSHREQSTRMICPTYVIQIPLLSPSLPIQSGVLPGTVVITNKTFNGFLKEEHELVSWFQVCCQSHRSGPLAWTPVGLKKVSILVRSFFGHPRTVHIREVSSFQGCPY